jgi:hypothetical protein
MAFQNNYSGWSPEIAQYVSQVSSSTGGLGMYPTQEQRNLFDRQQNLLSSTRNAIEWANQQRMTDPAYWAQAFGASGGGSVGKPVYQDTAGAYRKRLNSLMDNPDSIANTGAYKFAFNQGNEAINRNLAARGLLKSGNRLTELTKFGQGLASQQYGAEMDRLSNLVNSTRSGDIAKYGADANLYGTELQGQNQLKAMMMKNSMDMMKRYMAPGTHYTAAGIVNRWD